jgi:hypothetical protein
MDGRHCHLFHRPHSNVSATVSRTVRRLTAGFIGFAHSLNKSLTRFRSPIAAGLPGGYPPVLRKIFLRKELGLDLMRAKVG